MLDDRAKILLKALVERYIAEGAPVGSRTLAKASGMDLSAATIRNVMSDLEELGLIASPHTSAGRVPTSRGYRLFVDTMLTHEGGGELMGLDAQPLSPDQPQRVIINAAQLISNLSSFVGVVQAPRRGSAFRHIEFLRLADKRVLLIIVSPDGDVQNRMMLTAHDYTQSELTEATNYLNHHFAGRDIEQVREALRAEVDQLRSHVAQLMQAAVATSSEVLKPAPTEEIVISGERNLLAHTDFTQVGSLRKAFDMFEHKVQLLRLLDASSQADGVRIYIGGESGVVPVEELSVVSAPYAVNGQVVGQLAVVGPTRMPYDRMIQIVTITAKMVSNALSYQR